MNINYAWRDFSIGLGAEGDYHAVAEYIRTPVTFRLLSLACESTLGSAVFLSSTLGKQKPKLLVIGGDKSWDEIHSESKEHLLFFGSTWRDCPELLTPLQFSYPAVFLSLPPAFASASFLSPLTACLAALPLRTKFPT